MGFEDLIFWLFLAFALLSRAFAWIIERLREQQRRQPGSAPAPRVPSGAPSSQRADQTDNVGDEDFFDESWDNNGWDDNNWDQEPRRRGTEQPITGDARAPRPQPRETLTTRELRPRVGISQFHDPAPAAMTVHTAKDQGLWLRRQLGLDQRSALQRSILLMTVLGPCRANESETRQASSRD
jgi:hypothetical protein